MSRPKKRRAWTPAELNILKTGSRKHKPARVIAKQTRRTPGAVRQKAFEQGLSLETRPQALAA